MGRWNTPQNEVTNDVRQVFHPFSSLPEDLLHLLVNISLYLSRRYDIHNNSGSGYIPSQAY